MARIVKALKRRKFSMRPLDVVELRESSQIRRNFIVQEPSFWSASLPPLTRKFTHQSQCDKGE